MILPVANAFHAGDGNLHPLIMFDANDKESLRKCEEFGADISKILCKSWWSINRGTWCGNRKKRTNV